MWVRIYILLVCCSAATHSWARDIYVNNVTGDDRYDGNAPVAANLYGPYRTLTRALKASAKGDRVILANTGEAYRECIALQGGRQSGYPDAPFELIGNGAVLEGAERVSPDDWSFVAGNVFRFRPPR